MGRLIDISPTINPNLAVFPGDQEYRRTVSKNVALGDRYTLSSISTTLHLGAHADAPSHLQPGGDDIDERDLDFYYGRCQVINVDLSPGERVEAENIPANVEAPRVLIATHSYPNPEQWHGSYNGLAATLIHRLADQGVILAGIDTPSIDPLVDEVLEAHRAAGSANMAILEGLVLFGISDGLYTLIALPLKLEGAEASPVRAALVMP